VATVKYKGSGGFFQPPSYVRLAGGLFDFNDVTPGTPIIHPGFSNDPLEDFSLEIDESFNASAPTLKSGVTLTGDRLKEYNTAAKWALFAEVTSGDWYRGDLVNRLGHPDLYNVAREGQICLDPLFGMLRLTGDGRMLDRAVDGFTKLKDTSVIEWEIIGGSNWTGSEAVEVGDPWSPYWKKLYRGSGGSSSYNGTDLLLLNSLKLYAMISEFAYALHVNRGKASPAGYDYTALADEWGGIAEDWYAQWAGEPGNDWTQNYRGVDGLANEADRFPSGGRWRSRAPWGVYPVKMRNESHVALDSTILQYFLGRLGQTGLWDIPNPEDALSVCDDMVARELDRAYVPCTTSYGDTLLPRLSSWFTGASDSYASVEAHRSTYSGYLAGRYIQRRLIGRWNDLFTDDVMAKITRAYSASILSDGRMHRRLGFGSTGSGLLIDDPDATPTENLFRQSLKAYARMTVFEVGSTYLEDVSNTVQAGYAGGWNNPNAGNLAFGLFVKHALALV